ncbi:MAG: DUF2141 domain-containing protein [Ignavibacteriaceae bacterium]|nr:DUF2141 domain-containing protein [Ignavibacteriaceae bacterium]
MIGYREHCKKAFTVREYILFTLIVFFSVHIIFAEGIEKSSDKGSLIVKIIGFENNKGDCRIALDKLKNVYEGGDSVFIGKILPIINSEVSLKIDSLNYGNYAIKVFHDENSNGELDSNFLGIPTEDYGFSNNASSWFGPPSWEKAVFLFNHEEMSIEISVD